MTVSGEENMEPGFIEATEGPLFTMLHKPPADVESLGALLYIHPFAEELNKARRMAAVQARRFAEAGYWVLQPDLYGCGDSAGEFGEARWETWLADLDRCASELESRSGHPVCLWGLRLGCVLGSELASRFPGRFSGLLMWQPVLNGEQMLTQFLRIRLAAGMQSGETGSTRQLREMLQEGEGLEIGGYWLAPQLAAAVDAARLEPPLQSGLPVWWLELAADKQRGLAPASRKVVNQWMAQGTAVVAEAVEGVPFWNTQEIVEAPALWQRTEALLQSA